MPKHPPLLPSHTLPQRLMFAEVTALRRTAFADMGARWSARVAAEAAAAAAAVASPARTTTAGASSRSGRDASAWSPGGGGLAVDEASVAAWAAHAASVHQQCPLGVADDAAISEGDACMSVA